jgi:hypothetical protein
MSFLYILKESKLDWEKAKDIFYNLTDLQIAWMNGAEEEVTRKINKNTNEDVPFGRERDKISFDLRG